MEEQLKFGDLLATRSDNFLSKAIRWFMRKQHPGVPIFSHIACVTNVWGELYISEATKKGVVTHSLKDSGYDKKKQVVILRFKRGFTYGQVEAMSKKMIELSGTRYQFSNLPGWAIKLLFKINLFKKENEKRIYCSELGCIKINTAYPLTFINPNMVTPADHFMSGLYDVIDVNDILADFDRWKI